MELLQLIRTVVANTNSAHQTLVKSCRDTTMSDLIELSPAISQKKVWMAIGEFRTLCKSFGKHFLAICRKGKVHLHPISHLRDHAHVKKLASVSYRMLSPIAIHGNKAHNHLVEINSTETHAIKTGLQGLQYSLSPEPKASPNEHIRPRYCEELGAQHQWPIRCPS